MTLKEKIQHKVCDAILAASIAAVAGGWFIYQATRTDSTLWLAFSSVFSAWMTAVVILNVRTVRNGQAILRDPLFYLAAMRHDLAAMRHDLASASARSARREDPRRPFESPPVEDYDPED
jgi:hypothetical protein